MLKEKFGEKNPDVKVGWNLYKFGMIRTCRRPMSYAYFGAVKGSGIAKLVNES